MGGLQRQSGEHVGAGRDRKALEGGRDFTSYTRRRLTQSKCLQKTRNRLYCFASFVALCASTGGCTLDRQDLENIVPRPQRQRLRHPVLRMGAKGCGMNI